MESEFLETYSIPNKKNWHAYIFNNEVFVDKNIKQRYGSTKDSRDFKKALEQIGFPTANIRILTDCTADQIRLRFKEVNEKPDVSCIVFAFLTHGKKPNIICGYEGEVKLLELFSSKESDLCNLLPGVPKLIFISSCCESDTAGIEQEDAELIRFERLQKPPTAADMLICYPSSLPHPSEEDENTGSWFMQSLCNLLNEHGTSTDLVAFLKDISGPQEPNSSDSPKYPCFVSTLTKLLKF